MRLTHHIGFACIRKTILLSAPFHGRSEVCFFFLLEEVKFKIIIKIQSSFNQKAKNKKKSWNSPHTFYIRFVFSACCGDCSCCCIYLLLLAPLQWTGCSMGGWTGSGGRVRVLIGVLCLFSLYSVSAVLFDPFPPSLCGQLYDYLLLHVSTCTCTHSCVSQSQGRQTHKEMAMQRASSLALKNNVAVTVDWQRAQLKFWHIFHFKKNILKTAYDAFFHAMLLVTGDTSSQVFFFFFLIIWVFMLIVVFIHLYE